MVRGVPPEKQKELLPEAWFDAWWEAAVRADPAQGRDRKLGDALK